VGSKGEGRNKKMKWKLKQKLSQYYDDFAEMG
jgi:hypothetical protein